MLGAEESWVASTMTELNIIRVTHPAEVLALTENILRAVTNRTHRQTLPIPGRHDVTICQAISIWVFCSEN